MLGRCQEGLRIGRWSLDGKVDFDLVTYFAPVLSGVDDGTARFATEAHARSYPGMEATTFPLRQSQVLYAGGLRPNASGASPRPGPNSAWPRVLSN